MRPELPSRSIGSQQVTVTVPSILIGKTCLKLPLLSSTSTKRSTIPLSFYMHMPHMGLLFRYARVDWRSSQLPPGCPRGKKIADASGLRGIGEAIEAVRRDLPADVRKGGYK